MGESQMVRSVDAAASVDGLLALHDAQAADVYGFILRRCGDVELAEDLTQDTFVTAARHVRNTAEVPSPAWLYQVARSRLVDHWRRETRKVRKLRLVSAGRRDQAAADPADGVVSAQRVMAALDGLPASQRAALVLRYLDGYSVRQVADTLGRTTKAIESLLARARQNFELSYGVQNRE